LPSDVVAVVRRALAVAPVDRFPTSEDLRRAFAVVRRGQPPVALPDLAAWVARALS